MPISAFGIFALVCVLLNYVMIIMILPGYYIFYEFNIKNRFTCINKCLKKMCSKCRKGKQSESREGDIEKDSVKVTPIPLENKEKE